MPSMALPAAAPPAVPIAVPQLLPVAPPPTIDPAAAPAPVAAAVPFGWNSATSLIVSSPVASMAAFISFASFDKAHSLVGFISKE